MGNGTSKKKEREPGVYHTPLSLSQPPKLIQAKCPPIDTRWWLRPVPLQQPLGASRYHNQLGVGLIGRVPASLPPVSPPSAITIELPPSQKLWTELYGENRSNREHLNSFNTRIQDNTDRFLRDSEREIHRIRLERTRLESEAIRKEEPIKRPPQTIYSYFNIADRLKGFRTYDSKYFSTEKKRPELTPQMLADINEASRPHPLNEALVELDGVQILRKDIQTLLGLNWLNDEIVNAYMNLIVLRGGKANNKRVYAFNTFFYPKLRESGFSSIRRWTRKVNIFSYDYILVPVHLGNHWCLALIDFEERSISYYDSLGGGPSGCCDSLLDYLREECNDKKKQDFDTENWRLIDKYSDGIPQQRNCSDCGVFACTYAEYLTRKAKLSFGQEHMPYFRKKMIYEIIKKQILE